MEKTKLFRACQLLQEMAFNHKIYDLSFPQYFRRNPVTKVWQKLTCRTLKKPKFYSAKQCLY